LCCGAHRSCTDKSMIHINTLPTVLQSRRPA